MKHHFIPVFSSSSSNLYIFKPDVKGLRLTTTSCQSGLQHLDKMLHCMWLDRWKSILIKTLDWWLKWQKFATVAEIKVVGLCGDRCFVCHLYWRYGSRMIINKCNLHYCEDSEVVVFQMFAEVFTILISICVYIFWSANDTLMPFRVLLENTHELCLSLIHFPYSPVLVNVTLVTGEFWVWFFFSLHFLQ